jgi:hypothetical protein
MGTPQGLQLLDAEMAERQIELTAAFETLREQLNMWDAAAHSALAVVDSSVFLSHPQSRAIVEASAGPRQGDRRRSKLPPRRCTWSRLASSPPAAASVAAAPAAVPAG